MHRVPRQRQPAGPPTSRGDDDRGAAPYVPATTSLRVLREAAQGCRGCELYRRATQAVVGDGPRAAAIMLIGEQPGDREDLKVTRDGGVVRASSISPATIATLHPSAALRAPDEEARREMFDTLVSHLRLASRAAAGHGRR